MRVRELMARLQEADRESLVVVSPTWPTVTQFNHVASTEIAKIVLGWSGTTTAFILTIGSGPTAGYCAPDGDEPSLYPSHEWQDGPPEDDNQPDS